MQQKIQLYCNDELLDLLDSEEEPIQLVMQANDLGNLTSVDANYTKRFNIPLTLRNKAILGYPGEIFIYKKPNAYDFYSARLIYAGIEVIQNGKLLVVQVNNNEVDVMVTSGNFDFITLLGYQLYDMGDSLSPATNYGTKLVWKPYDHLRNVANAAGSQDKTDGWIWPIIDYGDVESAYPYAGYINVRNQRPAFFLHTAIELLVQAATGYTIDKQKSCLYSDPKYWNLYSRMLIPFSNGSFDHGTDYQNTPATNAMVNNPLGTQFVFNPGPVHQGVIPFNQTYYGPVTEFVNGKVEIVFDLYLFGRATGTNPTEVFISIAVNQTLDGTSAILAETSFNLANSGHRISGSGGAIITDQTFTNNKLSIDAELAPGMELSVTYGVTASLETTFIMKAGATFSFIPTEQAVLWNQPIQCERILPDISETDLLKFVLQTFGCMIIANPNDGTVIFGSFKQIVANIPNAMDWSDKCVDMGKQVVFNLGNYSQVNRLSYQQDDSIPLNFIPKFFADDSIAINDKTLNPTAPVQYLFQVPFAPSINRPYFGGTITQINDPSATPTPFSVGNSPRILIDQKIDLRQLGNNADGSTKIVTFADNDQGHEDPTVTQIVNGIISVPYFYKPDGDINLDPAPRHLCFCDKGGMPGLKSTYYPEFVNILTDTKKVTRYFYLTPLDIKYFDFLTPVYLRQDNAMFYVNKIDSWTAGNPCKVELIRI